MKLIIALALAAVAVSGCVVVPTGPGYRDGAYYHGYNHGYDRGYYRNEGNYRDDGYHEHG